VRLYKGPKLVQDDVDLDSKIEAKMEYIVVKQQEGQNIACKVSQWTWVTEYQDSPNYDDYMLQTCCFYLHDLYYL